MEESLKAPIVRKRMMSALFASQSLFSASTIAGFTLMPIIAANLSGNDSAVGVPPTVTLIGRAISAYPAGWLMDRLGRRPGLALGYLLATIGGLLSVLSITPWASFWWFCAGGFFLGAGRGVIEQGRYIAAEISPPEKRPDAIALIVFAGTIGAVGGPLMVEPSVMWAETAGWAGHTGPFIGATLFTTISILLILFFLRPDPLVVARAYAKDDENQSAATTVRTMREIYSIGNVRFGVLAMVVGQFVMTLIMIITPLHMNHNHHGAGAISWVIMAHTLGMYGLSSLTGRLSHKVGDVNLVWIGAAVLAISAVLTPVSHHVPMLAFALFLLGLGWNFCFIAGSAILSGALSPNERGRAQGAAETMVALAAGAGSLGTGAVFAHSGIVTVSAIGLVVSMLLVGGTGWWRRRAVASS